MCILIIIIEINVARRFANNKFNHVLIQTHYILIVEVNVESKLKITSTSNPALFAGQNPNLDSVFAAQN